MKLVFVLRSVVTHGGVERAVVDKMNHLAECGHLVLLVTYEQGQHPIEYPLLSIVNHNDLNCRMFPLYHLRQPIRIIKMLQMKRTFKLRFHRLISDIRPDVIVTVTNAYDFMNEIMTAPYGKKIVESHGAFTSITKGNTWKETVKSKLLLRAIMNSDLVISLTQADSDCWKPYVKRVKSVPNHVSFYVDNIGMTPKKEGRILYVGRLSLEKRIDRLIDAFSLIANRFPDWYVDIYGAGEIKEELKNLISKYKLNDCVHLLEPTHHIVDEYLKSQFIVLCSDNEGFGLVLVEAMACGLPCVSTRCPFGPLEIVEDGVTGILCDMNSRDLATKMEWMITHEAERKQMGIMAHKAVARFKKENVMKEWEQAYFSVLE